MQINRIFHIRTLLLVFIILTCVVSITILHSCARKITLVTIMLFYWQVLFTIILYMHWQNINYMYDTIGYTTIRIHARMRSFIRLYRVATSFPINIPYKYSTSVDASLYNCIVTQCCHLATLNCEQSRASVRVSVVASKPCLLVDCGILLKFKFKLIYFANTNMIQKRQLWTLILRQGDSY